MSAGAGRYAWEQQQKAEADAAWAKVEQAHRGGKHGTEGFTTNFENAGNLDDLRSMIMSASPGRMRSVAQEYASIHEAITSAAKDMGQHVENMLANWSGAAADGFREHASKLNTSLTNGAQYAQNAQHALENSAGALEHAQATMPKKPSDLGRLARALTTEGANDYQFKQDAAKYGLAGALAKDGSSLTMEGEDYQKAVLVMEQLATKYNANAAALQSGPGTRIQGGNWPPPVAPVKKEPVTPPSGGNVRSPHQGSAGGSVSGGGGDRTTRGLTEPVAPHLAGSGTNTGVTGGVAEIKPTGLPPSSTSLDGISGGIKTSGNGAGGGGTTPGGFSPGGGLGSGGLANGGALGGLGASGVGGLRLGNSGGHASGAAAEEGGYGALGANGGAEAGVGAGESGSGLTGGETRLTGETSGSAAGAEGSEGMMGGIGGIGRGNGRKNKRKQRASYLVEDEETWTQGPEPVPPVIG
jgi:WXG100 family type VII secretion target